MQTVLLGVAFAALSVIWWPTPYALAEDTRVARGTVSAIGSSSLSVTVRDQEMKFAVDPKTVVVSRGAGTKTRTAQASGKTGIKLADVFTVGQGVAVTYHEMSGQLHASVIRAVYAGVGGGSDEALPEALNATGTV